MRVLAWNIQNFTMKRIHDASGDDNAEIQASMSRSMANMDYITTTVEQADPDVFVVIEALAEKGGLQTLATGRGPAGLTFLLGRLRLSQSDEWCLVPPLRVNPEDALGARTYTETVGVFWRDDRLEFTGPLSWPNGPANDTGPPVPQGGGNAGAYPYPWDWAAGDGTTAAARCYFTDENGQEVLFNEPEHRRPYQTTFRERAGLGRTVNLYSVHFKPGAVNAKIGAARLSHVVGDPPAGSLTLVVGDFNINLMHPTAVEDAALGLWGRGFAEYTQLACGTPTMLKQRDMALPGGYTQGLCLDFGFVRYANGVPRPASTPLAVVVERVAGTAAVGPLPAFTTAMSKTLTEIGGIADFGKQMHLFRKRWNYGHISPPRAGTSDHLPVLFDV